MQLHLVVIREQQQKEHTMQQVVILQLLSTLTHADYTRPS